MAFALFAFIAIFLLIGSAGLLVFYRAAMMQRLSQAIAPKRVERWSEASRWSGPENRSRQWFSRSKKYCRRVPHEVSVVQKRLIRAGFREDSHVRLLYGAKVLVPMLLFIFVLSSGATAHFSPFYACLLALAIGYLAPDFWLGRRIKKRQTNMRLGLPDFSI